LAHDLHDLNREPLKRGGFVATVERVADDPEIVEFTFSSEQPVERWFGREVLSHQPGAMNMERLNSGAAPWLWNHNTDVVLGVVERAWQKPDGRGAVRTRWSPNTRHEGSEEWKVRQNWETGIIRNVSFMYSIDEDPDFSAREGVALVTAYTPMEVSAVSVPADHTVGNGRAARPGVPASAVSTHQPSPTPMEDTNTIDIEAVRAQAQADSRARTAAIIDLCRTHGMDDKLNDFVARDVSVSEVQGEILAELGKRSKAPQHAAPAQRAQPIAGAAPSADIGLSDREVRQYSFLRAMRAQLMPNDRAAFEDAGFEREVSQAVAQRMGISPKGMLIAHDVLSARTLTVGSPTSAGDLVFTDGRPESFIELLRKRNVLTGLGVQILSGLTGPVAIPRQTGSATAYWVGEQGEGTESEQTIDQVNLTPKTVTAWTRFSRLLMMQSSIDVENMVRNDLVTVIALELARAALYGTGSSSQPQGLKFVTGINTEDFGAAQPTYPELVSMETKIAADDADIGTMGYVTNATVFGGFKTTEKASGTAQFVLEPGGTVNSYNVVRSNQVESGDVFFGVWSQMLMGMWGALDLQVNPYSEDKAGNIRVVTFQSADVAVRHPESFCRGNNTL
jgi:HK97 family phage major capsid protein